MSRIVMALVPFLLLSLFSMAQPSNRTTSTKAERKAAKAAEREENRKQLLELLESRQFVLEANTIANRYGQLIPVSPNTNFVAALEDQGVIQFAIGFGPGLNGLGGITEDGKITKYEIIEQKSGFTVHMRLFGTIYGSSDLFLNVTTSGFAQVRVVTLRGGRFSFNGLLLPVEDSNVFQGNSFF